jgi:hypothetical protein
MQTAVMTSVAEIERVFRAEYGRAVAIMVRVFGDIDIDIAEDAVQDAFAAAAHVWPSAGMAPSPAGGSLPPPVTGRLTVSVERRPAPTGTPRPL